MTLVDLDDIPTKDETPRPLLIFEHLFQAAAAVAPPTTTPPHPPSVDAPPPTAATLPPPAAEPGGTHFNEQDEPPKDEPPNDEPPKDEPPKDEPGPRFKDQVHPGYIEPDLLAEAREEGKEEDLQEEAQEEDFEIPIAGARLITDTRIELEDLVQQLDLDRQHLEEQLQLKKRWIRGLIVAAVGLAAGVAAFLSICGTSGNCRGSDSKGTSPTSTRSRSVSEKRSITAFVNSITLSNQTLRYPSNATAEERALLWLIDVDLATTESNTLSLRQRYALATIWFQTLTGFGDNETAATWTNKDINECDWKDVDCDDAGRLVTSLIPVGDIGGQIPADLGLLTDLTSLGLTYNALNGTIPPSIGSLTSLTYLYLLGNALTGTIPSSIGLLTALNSLYLDGNALNGTIPTTIGSLTALTFLSLGFNELEGTIPSSIDSLTSLTFLELSYNELTGTISSSIGLLTALNSLELYNNSLTGTIPSSLGSLTDLNDLWLFNNGLMGTMPFCDSGSNQLFSQLVADCDKVSCPCCTGCCPTSRDGIPVSIFC